MIIDQHSPPRSLDSSQAEKAAEGVASTSARPASAHSPAAAPSSAGDPLTSPLSEVPGDQLDALLREGRRRGSLTQHDVVYALRSVELRAEVIAELIERIRDAGIAFEDETDETTVVTAKDLLTADLGKGEDLGKSEEVAPTPTAASQNGSDPLAGAPEPGSRSASPAVVALDSPRSAPRRAPARRERASRRAESDGAGEDGVSGSSADPVHMYLKEIGKVKLLDAALEVELAERIVAGSEAAAQLAIVATHEGASARSRRSA